MKTEANTSFALATINLDRKATPIIRVGEAIYRLANVVPRLLSAAPARGLMNLFDDWDRAEGELMEFAERARRGGASAAPIERTLVPDDFLAPLRYPSKVACMGANYYVHMHDDAGMKDYQKDKVVPTMFVKPATTTLVGCGRSVRYPSQSQQFDWEIELAAIVSRRARKVKAGHARAHVAAFTIGIDLSARDWQLHPKHPFKFDLYGGKAFDDSCPLGPWIIPARFVDDRNLHLQLRLNGEVKQDANTRDMIWPLDESIEALSSHVTLEPGDVIMTGTPAGVGMKTGTYMKVGDHLDAEIESLGLLHVEIMPDQDFPLDPTLS